MTSILIRRESTGSEDHVIREAVTAMVWVPAQDNHGFPQCQKLHENAADSHTDSAATVSDRHGTLPRRRLV